MVFHHVPRRIFRTDRLLGRDVTAQEVTEIHRDTIAMVGHMELQVQRFGTILLIVSLSDISRL